MSLNISFNPFVKDLEELSFTSKNESFKKVKHSINSNVDYDKLLAYLIDNKGKLDVFFQATSYSRYFFNEKGKSIPNYSYFEKLRFELNESFLYNENEIKLSLILDNLNYSLDIIALKDLGVSLEEAKLFCKYMNEVYTFNLKVNNTHIFISNEAMKYLSHLNNIKLKKQNSFNPPLSLSLLTRPKSFNDIKGKNQEGVVTFIQSKYEATNTIPKAILLEGPYGTGKTSLSLIIAALKSCQNPINNNPCGKCDNCTDILNQKFTRDCSIMIDGATSNKQDVIDTINSYIANTPMHSNSKVVIIEEIQQLSTTAQNSLLKLMEESTEDNVHFILLSMTTLKKGGLKSRCQSFTLPSLNPQEIGIYLYETAGNLDNENILIKSTFNDYYDKKIYIDLMEVSEGSFRVSLQLLEKALTYGVPNKEELASLLDKEELTSNNFKLFSLYVYNPKEFFIKLKEIENNKIEEILTALYFIASDIEVYRSTTYIDQAWKKQEYNKLIKESRYLECINKLKDIIKSSKFLTRKTELILLLT